MEPVVAALESAKALDPPAKTVARVARRALSPRALKEADPAVQAGRFEVVVVPWQVPAGALHFAPTRFPHSIAEVMGD